MKILLDYVFPISVITTTPQASTAYLHQVCLVVKPNSANSANVGKVFQCSSTAQVASYTDNEEANQFFNAGMSKCYLLLSNDLDLEDALEENQNLFYSLLISSDFTDANIGGVAASLVVGDLTLTAKDKGEAGNDITIALVDGGTAGSEAVTVTDSAISVSMDDGVSTAQQIADAIEASTDAAALVSVAIATGEESTAQDAATADNLESGAEAINLGIYKGVTGVASADKDFLALQAAIGNRSAFFKKVANGAKNMCFAFGSMLANVTNWRNQQYIEMPFDDGVALLGDAVTLFDDKISFVISDDEFNTRLALFAVGGKAIVAPYVIKNLQVDMQSRALQWIALNQPAYTLSRAALLETRLQEDVINLYISRGMIESGTVSITLVQQNFVANGEIVVPEPKAMWRVVSELREEI